MKKVSYPAHKIIFEGAELSGKSYLMSQVFNFLEPKYNSGGKILDGCHWLNCDVGIFGTHYGLIALQKYLELMEKMRQANIMIEKFHLTEAVYQKLYNHHNFDFTAIEARLKKIKARVIVTTFDEKGELLRQRLADRLKLYPSYQRIAQKPKDYIQQQRLYLRFLKKSRLPYLIINASKLPNKKLVDEILIFIKEKS